MAPYKIIVIEVATAGLWSEALLNGVPVVRIRDGAQRVIQAKGNPWVIEGVNWLQVRLGFPAEQDGVGAGAELDVAAFEIEHGNPAAVPAPLATWSWDPDELPIEEPGLHMALERQIAPQQTHGRWRWEDAEPFDAADRPAVEALARQLHEALERRDVAEVNRLMAIKHDELGRGLDVPPAELEQDSAAGLQAAFAADDWRLEPLGAERLVLEPTASGRLVNVFGPEGGAPIRATVFDEPLDVKMTVSHLADGWSIVR